MGYVKTMVSVELGSEVALHMGDKFLNFRFVWHLPGPENDLEEFVSPF
jgi:hypothetical protein